MNNYTEFIIKDFTTYVMLTFKKDSISIDIRPQFLRKLPHYKYFCKLKKNRFDDLVVTGVLDLIDLPNLKEINCTGNKITRIINIPHIETLICSSNNISELDYLPDTLKYLDCSHNNLITNLDNLPSSLKYLNCSDCSITNLNSFPNYLNTLKCKSTKNNYIYYLPNKLEMLNSDNISNLIEIPDSLNEIYIDLDIIKSEITEKYFNDNFKKIKNGYYRRIIN